MNSLRCRRPGVAVADFAVAWRCAVGALHAAAAVLAPGSCSPAASEAVDYSLDAAGGADAAGRCCGPLFVDTGYCAAFVVGAVAHGVVGSQVEAGGADHEEVASVASVAAADLAEVRDSATVGAGYVVVYQEVRPDVALKKDCDFVGADYSQPCVVSELAPWHPIVWYPVGTARVHAQSVGPSHARRS